MARNEQLFERAQRSIPGGVNSPVRAFRSVGGTPRFIDRAEGPYFWDADGKRYIDYIGSWGPMILGHGHPAVVKAVQEAAARGLSYGAPTEAEVVMAEELLKLVPSMEQVRLVSSGTEAAMSAIRLARGAAGGGKGRRKIIKFEGCYHGHGLATIAEARRLHCAGLQDPADAVDHQCRQRLAFDFLGDDQQRTAGLGHLLQDRQQITDVADLLVVQQDIRVVENADLLLGIVDEVRRKVAAVELHALTQCVGRGNRLLP